MAVFLRAGIPPITFAADTDHISNLLGLLHGFLKQPLFLRNVRGSAVLFPPFAAAFAAEVHLPVSICCDRTERYGG